MSTVMKVLVVGGGIGGLSAAIGLTQRGVDVEVAELNKEWTVYHVGIIVQANFVRALAMLGLGDAAVQAGFPYKGLRFLDADGSMLAELPVTYSNIDDQGDKVVVDFTDGTRGTYDLVIGADGAYSKMRKLVCADAPTPEYTGQGVWRYNVPRPKDQDWLDLYIKGDRTTAGYCPLTEDTMYIMAVTEEPGNPRFPRETLAEEFRKRLEGFGGKLGKLREQVTDSNLVVYRPLEVCACPAPWHKGRIVLVGDAAHSTTPHLGQGAAMAVEDAVVLVDELASKQNTLDDALKRYMERRYERAMMIHDNSIMLGDWQMHPEKADRSQAEVTEYIRARIAEPL